MRFARYDLEGTTRAGVAGDGDRLHELAAGQTVEALIERGGLGALLEAGTAALGAEPGPPLADVRLPAALPAAPRAAAGRAPAARPRAPPPRPAPAPRAPPPPPPPAGPRRAPPTR